jgi:NitT/TauT family transport system permease protein
MPFASVLRRVLTAAAPLIALGASSVLNVTAFAGLVVVGAMAMAMYELFSVVERRTTGWAHRGSNGG